MKMSTMDKVAHLLVMVGGLNWGLIGFFEYSLVDDLFSNSVARVVYSVVGVAAVHMFYQMVMMMSKEKK